MRTETKRMRKSQMPYEIDTCSIGEILQAKAATGDKHAVRASKVLVVERNGSNGQRNGYIRSSK